MASCLVYFTQFRGNFDFDLWSRSSALGLLNAPYLVSNMKSVGEIASDMWPVLLVFYPFLRKLDLDL